MHSSLIPLLCYSSLGNSSFDKTRPILFSFDKNFPTGFQVAVTETWWHSVPSNLWSGSPSVWEKKNAWSQVKCPLKEMWCWRSLLAPFNLPTMISHEENTEFSWKTEGQPLSGDKTVHSPLLYFSVVLARMSATGSHLDWVYLQDNLPGGER